MKLIFLAKFNIDNAAPGGLTTLNGVVFTAN